MKIIFIKLLMNQLLVLLVLFYIACGDTYVDCIK